MRIGTSHFTSRDSAVRYYAGQRSLTRAEAAIEVQLKLQDGEIQIGPPNLKPRERYVIDPVEGRYFVFEDRP